MSKQFFLSGSNANFDISGVKQQKDVQLDLSEVRSNGRLNTVDPHAHTEVIVQEDVTGENIIFKKTVDVTASVEDAKRWHNELLHTSSYGEEMRPLMHVDGILINQYCLKRGISWQEFWSPQSNEEHVKALLTDPDLSLLRLRSYNSQCKR